MKPRTIPPDSERCMSMTHRPPNNGARCTKAHTDGRLCSQHQQWGALIPDEWLPSGLPVFYFASRAAVLEAASPSGRAD